MDLFNNINGVQLSSMHMLLLLLLLRVRPEEIQEDTTSRKDLNIKLKTLGYDGDLRKLTDEDVITEISRLENK